MKLKDVKIGQRVAYNGYYGTRVEDKYNTPRIIWEMSGDPFNGERFLLPSTLDYEVRLAPL